MKHDLQNKLSRFEATPPAGVWEKIVDALAEETTPQRLYHYQQAPPATAWHAIEAALENTGAPAKVVSLFSRFKKPLRYAAAAGIIAAILISTTLLLKRTEAGSVQAGGTTTVPATATKMPALPFNSNNNRPAATTVTTALPATEAAPVVSVPRRTLGFIKPQLLIPSIRFAGSFIPKSAAKEPVPDFSTADDYMVYTDGAGTTMKLPKKLFSLVNCKEGDGSCKERIHQLQHKLSTGGMAADFMGMLDMLRQLQ